MEGNFTFNADGLRASGSNGNGPPDYPNPASPAPSQPRTFGGTHILSLRSVFNAEAAANRLPAELVVKIFMSGAWTEWHELLPLTHICQHWRDVARGTPQLWADAAASVFKSHVEVGPIRCLPTLLERSAPYPLRLAIRSVPNVLRPESAIFEPHFALLGPHFARMAHLSVDIACTENVLAVLDAARAGMRNLEALHVRRVFAAVVTVDERVALDDSDLPLLHTLSISGFFFTRAIAVKSLKSVTIAEAPHSHHVFLAALERCALSLESLTVGHWAHPDWIVDGPDAVFPTVRLPNLRHLKATMYPHTSPAHFLPGLALPPDVRIDLNWNDAHDRSTHAFLPRHLEGLNAPPFFDAICVYLSTPNLIVVNCFVGGAERLCVQECLCSPTRVPAVLDEYMSADLTELTVYLGFDNPFKSFINGDHLRRFVAGCPNLRRLDLLGKAVRGAKIQMAQAFLDRLAEPDSGGGADASTRTKCQCLGFALEFEERPPDGTEYQAPDEQHYTRDCQLAAVRAELDQLEALLRAHGAAGGARLPRLELCITIVHVAPRDMLAPDYCRLADVRPSSHWTRKLSWFYRPRLLELADEVVFFGDGRSSQRVAGGGLVRQLTGAQAHNHNLASGRQERGRKTRRREW